MRKILTILTVSFLLMFNTVYAFGDDIDISGGNVSINYGTHNAGSNNGEVVLTDVGEKILKICNYFIYIAVGLSMMGLAYAATRLGTSAGNPRKKEEAQRGMLVCLICLALLGSIGLIINVAVGVFR